MSHILQSQRHRNAADSEARQQRGDVDAEVVERHQNQQRPDQYTRDEIDDVQRTGEHLIGAPLQLLRFQVEAHGPAGPQSDLEQNQNQYDVGNGALNPLRQCETGLRGIERNGNEQELLGIADEIGEEPDRHSVLGCRILLVARRHQASHDPQAHPHRHGDDSGDEPIGQRVAVQQFANRVDFMRKIIADHCTDYTGASSRRSLGTGSVGGWGEGIAFPFLKI
jgi:hypothetical protein